MLLLVLGLHSKQEKKAKKTSEDESFHHKYSFPLDYPFPPRNKPFTMGVIEGLKWSTEGPTGDTLTRA